MATKKNMIYLLVILAVLAINLVPSGIMADNSMYYKNLEYLGLYNANTFLTGEVNGVFNMPLNTHHLLLTAFRLLPGEVFPNALITALYIIILAVAGRFLIKSAKSYGFLVAAVGLFILFRRKFAAYLLTILPFGGIYTFLTAAICIIMASALQKKLDAKSLVPLCIVSLAFAMYDNITALCAIVLGIVIIMLSPLGKTKTIKTATVFAGAVIVILSLVFAINYKPVDYEEIFATAVDYGIKNYEDTEVSSYSQAVGFYLKNPSYLINYGQSLLNNAFYEPDNAPFSLWHTVKAKVIPVNIWVFALLSLAIIIFAITQYKKYGSICFCAVGITIMQWIALFASGIMYGISNLDRNLLLFNLVFDILMAIVITSAVYIIISRRNKLKEKYGVNQ